MDDGCPSPPAQNRVCRLIASGSHLGDEAKSLERIRMADAHRRHSSGGVASHPMLRVPELGRTLSSSVVADERRSLAAEAKELCRTQST